MAGAHAVSLLTLCGQAAMAKDVAHANVNRTWRKLTAIYEKNSLPLHAVELEETLARKRVQRAQGDWRKERRRCKKKGLRRAQKRVDQTIWDWQPLGSKRSRLVGGIARAKARHEFARWSLDQAKEAERMAGILYGGDTARSPFSGSAQEIDALYERIAHDKHCLIVRAGIPEQNQDDVLITRDEDNNTHFYFGGLDGPDGLDHGHYVMDTTDVVFYHRDPGGLHGGHNYIAERQLTAAAC